MVTLSFRAVVMPPRCLSPAHDLQLRTQARGYKPSLRPGLFFCDIRNRSSGLSNQPQIFKELTHLLK